MMKVAAVVIGGLSTNCYIVYRENQSECVLIDPGGEPNLIDAKLDMLGLKPVAVLLTHAHFDHAGAADYYKKLGCDIYLHRGDLHLLAAQSPSLIEDGQTLALCGLIFVIMHTPGHSDGSVCYVCENVIFSGDTLFFRSIGRTDLRGGDQNKMLQSLRRIIALKGDFWVYPGHGRSTTLQAERDSNPYVKFLD